MTESLYHAHFLNLIKIRLFAARLLIDKGEFEGALFKLWKNMVTCQCAARTLLSPVLCGLQPDDSKVASLVPYVNADEVHVVESV
jgi:hypothetical protein